MLRQAFHYVICREQNINGKGLVVLANRGSKDRMEACGLELIGHQMKLVEVLDALESDISFKGHQPNTLTKNYTSEYTMLMDKAKKKKSVQVASCEPNDTQTESDECTQPDSKGGDTEDVLSSDSQSCSSASSPLTSMQLSSEEDERNKGIHMASAKLIVACVFNEVRVVDISCSQLQSAAKKLKIPNQGQKRDKNGGGILLYIAEPLNYSQLEESTIQTRNDNFESIWIEVSRPKTKKILCGAIYKTPDADPAAFTSSVEEILNNVMSNDSEIVLIGDFNLNYLNPTSATKHFQQTTKSFHLKQIITKPTQVTEETRTLIDLFLTSRPELYTCGVIPVGFSDHSAIFRVRKLYNIKRPPPTIIQSRNYKNYDPAVFSDDVNKIPWDILKMEPTSNEAWIVFKDLFLSVADKHAPVATRTVHRVKKFSIEEVNEKFVCDELKRIKSKKSTGLDGMSARLLKDAAPVIVKPITYIINLTISTGEIPPELKEAKVTPIFKNGKRNEESNYRLISVLPLVSKIMERAIQVQLVKFLEANEVLSQSGFRKGHSTETAVTYLTDQILEHMDKQQMTGSVFIDLKKAFDLVDHNCLLQKLEHYGIRGKSLRTTEDLVHNEYNLDRTCHQTSPLSTNPKEIKKALQEDLERVVTWMEINRLVLNKDKTKGILFGTRQRLETVANFNITSGTNVEMVTKFTYLGVTLDEELKWKAHAEDVQKKVSKQLGLLRQIRSSLTLQAAQAYTNALLNQFLATQTQPGVKYPRAASLVCNDYKIEPRKSSPVRKVQGQPEIL
ncbi:putative RNA-directed DNA polymerase from transposon BS [Stylophora pistillata]|uniref:Putative RNA-directed DNA polymerase from transposon BS n=1 Tax=Stylophora pistillata TaxID=50429 RepID=A0A2B4RKP8_STYPI|nr:putative RNA-directed DNA polymerase from transposon BS [Stylophora pistillata]